MKFKHLLFLPLLSLFIISCTKNEGNNFTFTPVAPVVVDTTGSSVPAAGKGVFDGPDKPPTNGDNSNLLFGNPTNATTDITSQSQMDNYLINMNYYVESYNKTKLEPNWVSWHLDASNITSAAGRQDSFSPFSGLPTGWTQVTNTSYQSYDVYGFDRGHNCPSADRSSSLSANNSTFLMTNMIPQAPQNNQQTWGNFEDFLRTKVKAGNEVYIIMGSYGTGGVGLHGAWDKIGVLGVNVPKMVWKVAVILPVGDGDLLRVTSTTQVIAINTPNIQTINSNWKLYLTSISAIEAGNGNNLTLLSALPPTVREALKNKVDSGI